MDHLVAEDPVKHCSARHPVGCCTTWRTGQPAPPQEVVAVPGNSGGPMPTGLHQQGAQCEKPCMVLCQEDGQQHCRRQEPLQAELYEDTYAAQIGAADLG